MRPGGKLLGIAAASSMAALLAASAARADTPSRASLKLRDGTTVVGTIVATHPGKDYVVVTDDGRTRTVPADAVAVTSPLPSHDRVLLDDGTTADGTLTDLKPGVSVTIDGRTIDWAHVRDVVVRVQTASLPPAAGALAAGAAAGATVTTKTQLRADTSGASYDITRDCTGGPDLPQCHERTHIAMGPGGPSASYESEDASGRKSANISATGAHASLERDCAANPADERCTERGGIDLGPGGLSASYSKETVRSVKTPPSGSTNIQLTAGLGFGFGSFGGGGSSGSTSATILEIPIDLTIPILVGGRFPDRKGGSWSGIKIEPSGGVILMSMFFSEGAISGNGTLFGWHAGGSLAFQYLHFGALNEKTLQQKGFGVAVGGFAGVQGMNGSITSTGVIAGQSFSQSSSISNTDASYGPVLDITFPKYNAGTAKYSSTNIIFMVLPTGSFTFITGSVGFSF
ncbi:MAG TPA: hypothetical protein VIF09_15900 [Polyangiaceae bacterium]|jgi:hypothetical protein